MSESEALWNRAYAALEAHRTAADPNAQAALDRVAAKVLHASQIESFNPTNCSIREEAMSLDVLKGLAVYHSRACPLRDDDTIVVLETGGRRVVIDGNNRVNLWIKSDKPENRTMLVITPNAAAEKA